MSEILDKARRASVAYAATANAGANIYDAKSAADRNALSLVCDAVEAREEPMGTGNYWVTLEWTLRTMAPTDADGIDQKPVSDSIVNAVMGLVQIDNDSLRTALSSQIAAFTVMGFGERQDVEQSVDGDAWVFVWRREIYCAGF